MSQYWIADCLKEFDRWFKDLRLPCCWAKPWLLQRTRNSGPGIKEQFKDEAYTLRIPTNKVACEKCNKVKVFAVYSWFDKDDKLVTAPSAYNRRCQLLEEGEEPCWEIQGCRKVNGKVVLAIPVETKVNFREFL